MMEVFAPGCALVLYKPELAQKTGDFLNRELGCGQEHLICCRHEPHLAEGTRIINVCAGCDRRYRQLYKGITTISLWEIIAESASFPFPDYNGCVMTIQDACPTRDQKRIHKAVRTLLTRMNIRIIEPQKTKQRGSCCGDSFYGVLSVSEVKEKMKQRAQEMPADDVIVYCVSCIKSMFIGGRQPRYLLDLLFDEKTVPGNYEPDSWHAALDSFIRDH